MEKYLRPAKKASFFEYCLLQKGRWLAFAIVVNVILYAGYHYLYPVPDFIGDSLVYVYTALKNIDVSYRPPGYPYFLRILHFISTSAYLVVMVQYAFLLIASLFLHFSINYLLPFRSKIFQSISFAGLAINPFYLVLANMVDSDPLFAALTISWFALLLWILLRENWLVLILHIAILFFAFIVRYNALYYPVFTCIALLLAKKVSWKYRLAGILLTVFTIGGTYAKIKSITLKHTGANVFSGFSGWQWANNALYIYGKPDYQHPKFPEPDLAKIDSFVRLYHDSLLTSPVFHEKPGMVGSAYLWFPESPLRMYMAYYGARDDIFKYNAWYLVSGDIGKYGRRIIAHNPGLFARYFLLPNFYNYLYPPLEGLNGRVAYKQLWHQETITYFRLPPQDLNFAARPTLSVYIIDIYPKWHILLVLLCFGAPVVYIICFFKKHSQMHYKAGLIVAFLWLFLVGANMCFCISTSDMVLRYDSAWFALVFGVPIWLLDACYEEWKQRRQLIRY